MSNKSINSETLLQRIKNGDKVLVLDVRDEEKYQTGSLEIEQAETKNIPFVAMRDGDEEALERLSRLPKDIDIITVCTTGNKAQKAATFLQERGYAALPLEGGLTAWKERNTPSS